MRKYKIGDRVQYHTGAKNHGTITKFYPPHPTQGPEYEVKWDEYSIPQRSYYEGNLLPLRTDPPSDQQLADDLRRARDEYIRLLHAVLDRDFIVQVEGNANPLKRIANAEKPLIITKTITTQVVL